MTPPTFRHLEEMEVAEQNRWLISNAVLSFFTVGLIALMAVAGFNSHTDATKSIIEVREVAKGKSPTARPPSNLIIPVVDRR